MSVLSSDSGLKSEEQDMYLGLQLTLVVKNTKHHLKLLFFLPFSVPTVNPSSSNWKGLKDTTSPKDANY